ncbi:hypothetical protein O9X98_10545 [Agrobacterium salinitolerans]|nr:hypothetical protein [Agrobacterium salinitolerans]
MKTFGNISLAIIIGCLPVLAGCETTSSDSKKNTVSINRGNFESPADAKIGNDIKTILAQGGLDTNNPASAPAVAKADDTPKTLSTTATDLQTLVAQLDAGNAAAAQAPVTAAQAKAEPAKTTALALAEQPKQTKAQTQIITTTETTTFEPIGTPGELIPIVPEVAAQVPETKPKPVPRASNKTRRVVAEAESTYKSPTVKRF